MKRFKVTRIEIWEIIDSEHLGEPMTAADLQDTVQDEMLNSQDHPRFTDDDIFEVTPKEIVELKVEEVE